MVTLCASWVTSQFCVGRNRSVQVVRKQFPLRPAAAKSIHRSQGLYITNLCEDKIAISEDVKQEMKELRNSRKLELCISPIYRTDQVPFKLIFLNWRSLHKHIKETPRSNVTRMRKKQRQIEYKGVKS